MEEKVVSPPTPLNNLESVVMIKIFMINYVRPCKLLTLNGRGLWQLRDLEQRCPYPTTQKQLREIWRSVRRCKNFPCRKMETMKTTIFSVRLFLKLKLICIFGAKSWAETTHYQCIDFGIINQFEMNSSSLQRSKLGTCIMALPIP